MIRSILFFAILLFSQVTQAATKPLIIKSGKKDHIFRVEIADDDVSREQGLMFRKNLASDHGMLFIFKRIEVQKFWMMNTLIPLDMLFIQPDGRINKIAKMAQPEDLTRISSEIPILAVLEIKGGQADKLKLKENDIVVYPIFKNPPILKPKIKQAVKPASKPLPKSK